MSNIKIAVDNDAPNYNINGMITITFKKNVNDNTIPFMKNDKIILRYTKYYDGEYNVIYGTDDHIVIKQVYIEYVDYNDGFYGIMYNGQKDNYFNPLDTQYILFNGQYRTAVMDSNYFNYVIPYQYYNNTPLDGINAFSFSLHPMEYQPSGTCNFSLLKSKTLNYKLNDRYYNYLLKNNLNYKLSLYGINYNILRIHNGVSSIVFST